MTTNLPKPAIDLKEFCSFDSVDDMWVMLSASHLESEIDSEPLFRLAIVGEIDGAAEAELTSGMLRQIEKAIGDALQHRPLQVNEPLLPTGNAFRVYDKHYARHISDGVFINQDGHLCRITTGGVRVMSQKGYTVEKWAGIFASNGARVYVNDRIRVLSTTMDVKEQSNGIVHIRPVQEEVDSIGMTNEMKNAMNLFNDLRNRFPPCQVIGYKEKYFK